MAQACFDTKSQVCMISNEHIYKTHMPGNPTQVAIRNVQNAFVFGFLRWSRRFASQAQWRLHMTLLHLLYTRSKSLSYEFEIDWLYEILYCGACRSLLWGRFCDFGWGEETTSIGEGSQVFRICRKTRDEGGKFVPLLTLMLQIGIGMLCGGSIDSLDVALDTALSAAMDLAFDYMGDLGSDYVDAWEA